ncbi:MAG: aspartate ammonia-lyase [bacterium]|nr:aspartate ammonia-lyase [bacterium]
MQATIEALSRCTFLSNVDEAALALLAGVAKERATEAGVSLFERGDPRDAFFVVLAGQVAVRLRDDGLGDAPVVLLGPGESVGEAGLLERGFHTASATTPEPSRLLELPLEAVRAALVTNGAAAQAIFEAVARLMVRRLQYGAHRRVGWDRIYGAGENRTEHDLLGDLEVPRDARYGVQTLRAVRNFPISGVRIAHYPALIRALAAVKQAAVRANHDLDLLPTDVAKAIDQACQEIQHGHWHGHFPVDVVQGGAGTSTNMNANEVIANRALELMGRERGDYSRCHPNNHVNLSQSTNDAYPTAVNIATIMEQRGLRDALAELVSALRDKAREFEDVIKMGRTQLQDAVPMTLGQEFEAYAVTVQEDIARLEEAALLMHEINLGGTAIGTGINAHPDYRARAVEHLVTITGLDLVSAENLIEATPDTGAFVQFSSVLKRIAVKLSKICNDLRLLSSGPRAGLGEIRLPARQPGSSIMPGKVNPVIPEVVNQIAFRVIGNDLTITLASEAGQLQLNVMEPIITFSLFESLSMLTAGVRTLTERCIRGIEADRERCAELVERSIGVVTAIVPVLGYDRASAVAREALESGSSVREILLRDGDLTKEALEDLLSPASMLAPRTQPDS